jgi:hypothetical protein
MKEEFLKETHGKKEAVRGAGFHLTPYNEKAGQLFALKLKSENGRSGK